MNVLTQKRMLTFFIASLAGLLVSSCTKEVKNPVLAEAVPQESITYLTEESASTQAVELYTALFGGDLRGGFIPKVQSVDRIASSLRTADGTLDDHQGVLVVNFENNQGYMVLSESIFNEPIIYACPTGHLDPNVPTENPNIIPFLYNADALLAYNAASGGVITDLIDRDGNPVPKPPVDESKLYDYEFGPWETTFQVGPFVPVQWNHGQPFNLKLTPIDGHLPPVGCVATAVAQIMSYHRWPAYDWERIIRVSNNGEYFTDPYFREVISLLHKDLGKPENLDMTYTITKGSGAPSENVPRTFRAYGYQCGRFEDYNFDKIKSEIYAQRPVYVDGYSIKEVAISPKSLTWASAKYKEGHAWVIDGVRQVKRKVITIHRITKKIVDVAYEVKDLVHCNMGWGGPDDGYYLNKAFNTKKGPEMRSSPLRATVTYGEKGYYQYYNHIITQIQR